jgi:hypothetical protein
MTRTNWPDAPHPVAGVLGGALADRILRLEARLGEAVRHLENLEERLSALELRLQPGDHSAPDVRPERVWGDEAAEGGASTPQSRPHDVVAALPMLGRTFLVLAGAYLLRAVTDAGALPRAAGIFTGLAYGVAWIGLANRAGRQHRAASGTLYGAGAALIVFPLLYEATVRFHVLSPGASITVSTLVVAAALLVAARQRLRAVAWLAVAADMAMVLALARTTGALAPAAAHLVLVGVAALWLGYTCEWTLLRWPVALMADLTVMGATARLLGHRPVDPAAAVIGIQIFLVVAYIGSFALRTVFLGRNVIPFEVAQSVAALTIGFGGAALVARSTGDGIVALGAAGLVLGAASYAVAFAFVERRLGLKKNFYFYTSLALVMTMTGTVLMLSAQAAALVCTGLAIAGMALGGRLRRVTLTLHGALYLVAATVASNLLRDATKGMVATAATDWPGLGAVGMLVLLGHAISVSLPALQSPSPGRWLERMPRVTVMGLFVWCAVGVAALQLCPLFADATGALPDPGTLAAIRTTLLIAAVLALAAICRSKRFADAAWLIYPFLGLTAIKLVVSDFPSGRPTTLFVALALYGAGLIGAARLRRS